MLNAGDKEKDSSSSAGQREGFTDENIVSEMSHIAQDEEPGLEHIPDVVCIGF